MALKRVLIDTNAYSRLALGDNEVLDVLGEAETVYLSVFVLAELLAGFKGGQRERKNRDGLKTFMAAPSVKLLFATDTTAEIFAGVKDSLKRRGKPLPINDVWIASHGLEAAATLLTFDAHFDHVEGLQRWPER
ncbi:MAG: type II toxin-antitoxin system VapC family toxin [Myxococcales bacterium]|nr:type II toxin-antitoxin system VapC family toxin [Myxococcales bacterium]